MGRQRLTKALTVFNDGLGMVVIQDGFEFGARRRLGRRAIIRTK